MHARSLLALLIAACGPASPDEDATEAPGSSSTTTTTTGATTTTPTTGDDSGTASGDPAPDKLDLGPEPDVPPLPPPPTCDALPDVPPDGECEVLWHDATWDFIYGCLADAEPGACPDSASAAVEERLGGCTRCAYLRGSELCGPDPRREDACCYWGFGVTSTCPR